jgi:hypothetical protein
VRHSLRDISCFDELLDYLRDELDWPIGTLHVDDVAFDYEPMREFGLPQEAAIRIVSLKQLRPLKPYQDWSIFYVAFEQRYLPLRLVQRILAALCTRHRSCVSASMRRLWEPTDLLLIAMSGDSKTRRFDFAQCTTAYSAQRDVLLLGWQNEEPEPRIDWIEAQVRAGLRWPDAHDPDAAANWPARWRETFLARRAKPRPAWSELTPGQQKTLIDLYSAGDHTVDALPYTADFSWLMDCFNRATGLSLTPHEFWRALSTARKGGHLPKKQRGLPLNDIDGLVER